uniref:Ribosomal RNA methyltransferase FtsJ domain-containing protein n=2 Tax=Auxenochlorella protothecoides TaxID=3075 RepID=A0A1D2A4D0_AUXPR
MCVRGLEDAQEACLATQTPDVIVQFQSQTHAYRCVLLHQSGAFFPEGCGVEAEEVGPRTDHAGPCLVLLKGVTLPRADFEAWLRDSVMEWAVMRVYWIKQRCADRQELVRQLLAQGPPDGALRLHCFPHKLEPWLGDALPLDWVLQPAAFTHVLDVVETAAGVAYSMSPCPRLFRTTAWTRPRLEGPLCKATSKLAEALAWVKHAPRGGVAIDLGASPGGWSTLLASSMHHVISIDPADMAPEALALPNLTHIKSRVETALPQIEAALAAAGAGGGADLLVSDMNKHPSAMIGMVEPLLAYLKPGGHLLLTLKFFSRSRDKAWDPTNCPQLAGFRGVQVVWLLANTAHERTCVAIKC